MASNSQPEHVIGDSLSLKGDFAVQPLDDKSSVPVDGPLPDDTEASPKPATPAVDNEDASFPSLSPVPGPIESPIVQSDSPTSPLQARRESIGSATTLEDGEVREDVIEDSEGTQVVSAIQESDFIEDDGTFAEAATSSEAEANNTAEVEVARSQKNGTEVNMPEVATFMAATTSKVGATEPTPCEESVEQETLEPVDHTDMPAKKADDVAVTNGEEADIDHSSAQVKRSVPPHLRSDLPLPSVRQPASSGLKHPMGGSLGASRFADIPRAPRFHGPNNSFVNYNNGSSREEAARLNAQLMKARNELAHERQKNSNMRKAVEEEMQKNVDEALAASTLELLNKQIKTLSHQAKVDAKERELQYREDRIEQLEIYLTEGQKYLHRQEAGEEGLSIATVVDEHGKRQAELQAMKDMADREAKLATRLQGLQIRESVQQSREAQFKAVIRGSLEAELRDKAAAEMQIKFDEVAELEFNRGFGEGKAAGRKEEDVGLRQKGFYEGYDACHRAQVALQKLRAGRIPRDSPELDFLYDASHPFNAYNVGAHSSGMVLSTPKVNGVGVPQLKPAPVAVKPVQEQVKVDAPVRKLPPPPTARPTFASELRGNTHQMHNGHYVLANGSSSSSTAGTSKTPGVNGTVNDLYAGRVIVQYEESEEDNLIDLN